jgi:voltage-gated potassium channel
MSYWRIISLVGVLVLLVFAGTMGYHFLENWSYVDAFYMTIIVLSTVGLGGVKELSSEGKLFTVGLIVLGVVVVGYGINTLAQRVLEIQFTTYLGRRRMEKETKRLKNHFILCGAGRVGSRVIKEFAQHQVPFVVIEKNEGVAQRLASEGCLTIHGDAADEEILHKAGVERARGLIAAISTDADNVYVTLTAKGLRPDLLVVARAQEENAARKLLKAGADKVILPAQSAGQILAQSVLKPHVAHFIESVTAGDMAQLNLQLEEILISESSRIAGLTLQQSEIRQNLGIIILAMKRKDGIMQFNPKPDSVIESGDFLIALGMADSMRKLEELAG